MSTPRALWLPEVLRAAGLTVVEHPGWQQRSHGDFTRLRAVVWHHDASAPGDSPGVPDFLARQWDANRASAHLWVNRQGVWHVIGCGVGFHAGRVLAGKPGNHDSLGVETDHTGGEDWPAELLTSLRVGTAAILRKLGQPAATGLEFHRTICSPVGRKPDPDGLDLDVERGRVGVLIESRRWDPRPGKEVTDRTRPHGDDVILYVLDTISQAWLAMPATRTKRRVVGAERVALMASPLAFRHRSRDEDILAMLATYTEVK